MSSPDPNDLHQRILAYCEAHGVSRSRFGMLATGDPRLVFDINGGRDLRTSTVRKIERVLSEPPEAQA